MADKKTRGSILSPPPPPPAPSKVLSPNGRLMEPAHTATSSSSSPPLTNGHAEGTVTNGYKTDNNKPKTSSKPSKLTRAFSSGSMTLPSFNKLGKGRKSSKTKQAPDTDWFSEPTGNNDDSPKAPDTSGGGVGVVATTTITNGETDEKSQWKLPGIGTVPKLQQRKSVPSMTKPPLLPKPNSNILLSEQDHGSALPPPPPSPPPPPQQAPLPSNVSTDNIAASQRELPPIPSSVLILNPNSAGRELPPVPSLNLGDGTIDDVVAASTIMEEETTQEFSCPANDVSLSTPERNIDRRYSPLPKTPPKDSRDNGYRPLPKSPAQSDDEENEDVRNSLTTSSDLSNSSLVEENSGNESTKETVDSPQACIDGKLTSVVETQEEESSFIASQESPSTSTYVNLTDVNGRGDLPSSQDYQDGQDEVEIRDYTIKEIITTYSYALPVRVRVLQGYCSDTSEVNISTDDVYNIHSIKHTKMLKVKDGDGMTHRVSLDAPVKIGMIYNPSQDDDVSLNGYEFKTISDVTAMSNLPKIIAATQAVPSNDDKNSVSEGEIFFVRQIHRSMFKGKKGLKVFSLLTRSNKILFDDCAGSFSTKPSLVRISLPELLERMGDVIFMSRAVIYPTTDEASSSEFPGTLSRVVTLMDCSTKTSLVASDVSYLDDDALEEANLVPVPKESSSSFDLPLEDDIENLEIAVLKWTYPEGEVDEEEELNHVYDDTLGVSEELGQSRASNLSNSINVTSSSSGTPGLDDVIDDHTYMNLEQQQLQVDALSSENLAEKEKTFIEEDEEAGYDTVGIHLIRDEDTPLHLKASNEDLKKEDPPAAGNRGYSSISLRRSESAKSESKPQLMPKPGYSAIQHRSVNGVMKIEGESEGRGFVHGGKISEGDKLQNKSLDAKIPEPSSDMSRMQTMLELLTLKMVAIDSQLNSLATAPAISEVTKPVQPIQPPGPAQENAKEEAVKSTVEVNREYLSSLSSEQIGDLMEAMSLGVYRQKILDEHISGEILLECDEDVLKEEIGITSKIHCIRLMKIINGQHSAQAVLEKNK